MSTMYVVAGLGGRQARRSGAAERVQQTAHRNGWTVETVMLDELAPTADRVVACGGDGLVHHVANRLAGTETPLAIVPSGTGNDVARALGVTHANAIAIATGSPGEPADTVAIDLIDAEGRFGVGVVTAGYSGRVNATANKMRFPPGGSKYTFAALREIGRLEPVAVRLVLDGGAQVLEGDFTMIAIGNTTYFGGGMQICPDADPSDGLLDVVTVGPVSRAQFVRWLPKVFGGTHLGHEAVTTARAATIEIVTDEALWVDGEPFIAAPTTLRCAPKALVVLGDPAR